MPIWVDTAAAILSRIIGVPSRTDPPFVIGEWMGDDPISTPSSGIVVLTRARLGSWLAVLRFMSLNRPLLEQLRREPGLVGFTLRANLDAREFWTLSAWRGEAQMRRFVTSPPHVAAARWLRQGAHDFDSAFLAPGVKGWCEVDEAMARRVR